MSRKFTVMGALLALSILGYMVLGAVGSWDFLLPFRATKLAALMLVGTCIATATVLFQTITANRILTPSVLGFDSLYVLVLTLLVYGLGAAGYAAVPTALVFALNLVVMTGLGLVLFIALMAGGRGDLFKLVLTGIMIGMLIRAVTGFLQRMIDPGEFQTIQSASFARFTYVDPTLLAITAAVALPALWLSWRMRFRLDVLALGAETSTGLGEPPAPGQRQALVLICVLIATATALTGPLSSGLSGPSNFFGLIVTALAHLVLPSARHTTLLPMAALIACIVLIGGQTVMERVLHLSTPLPVVIELLGGTLFLFLLLRRPKL